MRPFMRRANVKLIPYSSLFFMKYYTFQKLGTYSPRLNSSSNLMRNIAWFVAHPPARRIKLRKLIVDDLTSTLLFRSFDEALSRLNATFPGKFSSLLIFHVNFPVIKLFPIARPLGKSGNEK